MSYGPLSENAKKLLNSKYAVFELHNVHVSKDAPKDIVEQMRKLRLEFYGDENVYGEKDYNGPVYPRTKV